MEDTGYIFDQVHVLRHSFRPNGPLQEELQTIATGADRPFVIYGSDERVVSLFDLTTRSYQGQKFQANATVERHSHGNFQLEAGLDASMLTSKAKGAIALRLAMNVFFTKEYERLVEALDEIDAGFRTYAPGIHATRLYVDIPFSQLGPISAAQERVSDFRKKLANERSRSLYQVFPEPHLNGLSAFRRVPLTFQLEESNEDETSLPHP